MSPATQAVVFLIIGAAGSKLYGSAGGWSLPRSYGPPRGAKAGWGLFLMYIGFGMGLTALAIAMS